MKKNQIIAASFTAVIILAVVLYYQMVDLGEGRINKPVNNNPIVEQDDEPEILENIPQEPENIPQETDEIDNKEVANSISTDLSICNENGRIMILMYHKFADTNDSNDEWTRTYTEFKNDLKLLYENNYRPISMTDYIEGNINVPYGMTPVVLTFDDGHAGQASFTKGEDGILKIKEKTAVGIMEEFNREHPDFELNGTFYISSTNFFGWTGKTSERLQYLVDLGFEIGNRTKTSYYLGNAKTAEKVQEEVGGFAKYIDEYLPGYKVNSLSLPGGSRTKTFADYLYSGEYEGFAYENKAIVSIYNSYGARSPIDNERDLKNLPRIKVGDKEKDLEYWIKYYNEHPEEKFVSDGNEMTFVINAADEQLVTVDTSYEKYVK